MKTFAFGPAHWALVDQALVSVGNFLVGVLMARSLSAHDLALYSLAYTTVLGLSTVHRTLVSQPMNVLGAQESRGARFWRYSNMLHMQWWMLPVVGLVAGLVGARYFPSVSLVPGVMVYLAAFCLQDFVRRYFYTDRQIRRALPGDALAYGGQVLVLVMLWATGQASVGVVFAAMTVPMLMAWFWTHRQVRQLDRVEAQGEPVPSRRTHLREHWDSGKWLVLSQIVWIGASQLIPFQLAAYASADEVTAYHVANSLMNALNVLRITMGNYLPSQTAAMYAQGGRPALASYLGRVSLLSVGVSLLAFLFFWLAGDFIIDILYGARFHHAKVIVPAMAVVHLLAMSSLITASGAQVIGATRIVFSSNVVALVITWGLGGYLISTWGLWGGVVLLAIGLLLPALIQAVNLAYLLSPARGVSHTNGC